MTNTGTSLRHRAFAGALGTLARRARGLAADVEGDAVVVTRTGPRTSPLGCVAACLVPLVFVYVGFVLDGVPAPLGWLFGLAGILVGVVFVIMVAWDIVSRERIRVSYEDMCINVVSPWGETKGTTVPVELIEGIEIGSPLGRRRRSLVVASDEGTLTFGQGLSQASLEFVRRMVLAKLSAA